jgi:hypothetical protein
MSVTLKVACERYLGIKPATGRQQISNGRLFADKIGRDWHVSLAEVRRYARESQGRELEVSE